MKSNNLHVYATGIATFAPFFLLAAAIPLGAPIIVIAAIQLLYLGLFVAYSLHVVFAENMDTFDKRMWVAGMFLLPAVFVTAYWAKYFYADIAWSRYAKY